MVAAIVMMGVCGCGKSTVGKRLAEQLGLPFVEGDDLHPPANVAKMARGEPLDDKDRQGFLRNVGEAIVAHSSGVVVSCSALKKTYRDLLRTFGPDTIFVLVNVPEQELRKRLSARKDHFMPASLLDSQLAILERPDDEERAIVVDGMLTPDAQATFIRESLLQFAW